ncbi:hypothetical protein D9758_009508 [Tetrapyrgos nigripes]|uniref:F-box domain-containing protein n=1 Tax=Tetrapyrgos nigripes TaxID=182062 RepID=A0A8H5LG16_9AGAR|nr:hypothetical protein D9758_009508 [Tetrapyrgos nigripes]
MNSTRNCSQSSTPEVPVSAMGNRDSTGRRPLELKLLQIFPSFQPRVQDIDLHVQSLRDRIRSPGSPTSSESSQISGLISKAEQDLSDYKKDIQSVENVLLDLKRKKEELERCVDHCKAYFSPIRRLPTEIMGDIFLYYQDLHRSNREDRQFREPLNGPLQQDEAITALVLSSVCKLWHSITLATPRLWSRFSLSISEKCGSVSHLLEIYLSRSKQHPLTFDIIVYDEGSNSNIVIRLLSAHSHRWFFASCYGRCPDLNMQTDLPLLQSLEVHDEEADSLDTFAGARTLRTVSLVGISRFLHSNLPWDQIQVLRACELQIWDVGLPKYVWGLTQKCRALRSLELDFDYYPPHEPAGFMSSIHLSKLENLCLQGVHWYDICELFSVSTLPSLRKLSLRLRDDGPDDGPTPDFAAFSAFISRSQCSISILRLEKLQRFTVQLACGMLQHIPTLIEIMVEEEELTWHRGNPPVMTTLFATLCVSPSPVEVDRQAGENKPALPLLRRLVMEVNPEQFEVSRFVEMVESRGMLPGGCLGALKSVRLILRWSSHAKNLPLLQPLEAWPGIEIISSTRASRRYLRDEDSWV